MKLTKIKNNNYFTYIGSKSIFKKIDNKYVRNEHTRCMFVLNPIDEVQSIPMYKIVAWKCAKSRFSPSFLRKRFVR